MLHQHNHTDSNRLHTHEVNEHNNANGHNNNNNISNSISKNNLAENCMESKPRNRPFLAKVIVANQAGDGQVDQPDGGHLYFELNDIVAIEEKLDDKWFLVKSDQQSGRLNISACRSLDEQVPVKLCQYLIDNKFYDLHICFASFVAQDVGDLSLTRGDIIVAISQVNEHWLQGQVCYDGQADSWPNLVVGQQVGTFPLNHCWKLDSDQVKAFCHDKISTKPSSQQPPGVFLKPAPQPWALPSIGAKKPTHVISATLSSSLSSGSSSLYSTDYQSSHLNNHINNNNINSDNFNAAFSEPFQTDQRRQHMFANNSINSQPPPRPQQLPRQIAACRKSVSEQAVASKPSSILTNRQQDKLKGWLHTVRKKTARLSTRITASLGLISLTRDEVFERHYESFKHLEKTIRTFIKNLTTFVEHFESFLLALQNTSEHLADFYRDKSHHQAELAEIRKKNKALACEHFHAFKRTIDRQVIAVSSQLLQKFAGPHQLVGKRGAKLLDFDTKTKEMESCRDLEKKAALRDEYVIAKDLYDRINGQLIEELPLFNQFALDIFKECVLVLLESRRNLILSYTKQTASLLETPLMATYTASDVASTILMSCENPVNRLPDSRPNCQDLSMILNQGGPGSGGLSKPASEHGSGQPSSSACGFGNDFSRPHSVNSRLSSEFDQMALAVREISSTPLSNLSDCPLEIDEQADEEQGGDHSDHQVDEVHVPVVRFDEADGHHEHQSNGLSDNKHNEDIEHAIQVSRAESRSSAQSTHANANRDQDNDLPPENHKEAGGNRGRKKKSKSQIYIASWPFIATGPNQLTIACNQPLKLIKDCDECGNSDWSLVKDKRGHLGYVPTSYIKKKE